MSTSFTIARIFLLFIVLSMTIALGSCAQGESSEHGSDTVFRTEESTGLVETTERRVADTIAYSGPPKANVNGWVLRSIGDETPSRGLNGTISFYYWGEINGDFSCTSYIFPHRKEGNELRISRKYYDDKYECQRKDSAREQEAVFAGAIEDIEKIGIEKKRLTLRGADGTVLVFTPADPPPTDPELRNSEWLLTSLASELPLPGTRLDLTVSKYTIGIGAGCNGFGGELIKFDEGELILSEEDREGLMGTNMGCPGARGKQEKRYLDTFESVTSYRVSGDRLELTNDDSDILIYSRIAN